MKRTKLLTYYASSLLRSGRFVNTWKYLNEWNSTKHLQTFSNVSRFILNQVKYQMASGIIACLVRSLRPSVSRLDRPSLVQVMLWRLFGDKPLSEPMLYCELDTREHISIECYIKFRSFSQENGPEDVFEMAATLSRLQHFNPFIYSLVSSDRSQ